MEWLKCARNLRKDRVNGPRNGSPLTVMSTRTLVPLRFQYLDGWFNIVWRLCVDLEPLVGELGNETGKRFEVVQAGEEFGTLRFYLSHHTDDIDERIGEAQKECSRTCEICGEQGNWVGGGRWNRVRCAEHGNGS